MNDCKSIYRTLRDAVRYMKNKSKISGKSGDSGGEENPAEADEGKDTEESHEGDLKDSLSFLLQSAASRYPRK